MRITSLFNDGMVIQSGRPIRLWGEAAPGAIIHLRIVRAGETQDCHAETDADGRWHAVLNALPPGGPYELHIEGDGETRTINDVLSGEVWLCAGQSNMAMTVSRSLNAETEIAAADHPTIRYFKVKQGVSAIPQETVRGHWQICNRETVGNFSAAAYYFARDLQHSLSRVGDIPCPIGILDASWGDTTAEAWTDRTALESYPELLPLLQQWDSLLVENPYAMIDLEPFHQSWRKQLTTYQGEEVTWLRDVDLSKASGANLPKAPARPTGLGDTHAPTVLYNSMIAPLTHFPIKGVCWYQGESNAIAGRSRQYHALLSALIGSWRGAWNDPELPFIFVQLANYDDVRAPHPDSDWPELREAQRKTLAEVPRTAMVVAIDVGMSNDIHPTNKQPIGHRLALAARALAYEHAITYSGPLSREVNRIGNRLQVTFDHVGSGLITSDGGPPRGFAIAGADHSFLPANAGIVGDSIIVDRPEIDCPVALRYAWAADPDCNLINVEGLPASPFRSDEL